METFAEGISPVYRRDPSLMDWFVWMQRAAASPGAATAFARMQMETDLTDVTPTIKVPTLVVHRSEDRAPRALSQNDSGWLERRDLRSWIRPL